MKKVNIGFEEGYVLSSTSFFKERKWQCFVDTTAKKQPPIIRLWRELDDNDEYTFNRYGIGIAKFKEEKHVYYRCYIGYKNWNHGGYGQGKKCKTLEDAYDDLKETIICCKKSFQFSIPMKDRVFTQPSKDKHDMLTTAEKFHMN